MGRAFLTVRPGRGVLFVSSRPPFETLMGEAASYPQLIFGFPSW